MKKLLLIAVVAALALTLVPLAVAGGPGGGGKLGHAKFNLVGKVVSVDTSKASETAAGTVVIKVKAGTKTVRELRGTEATFTVAATARIWLLTEDGKEAKTLADVPADAKVKVRGVITKVPAVDENGAPLVDDKGAPVMVKVYTVKDLKYFAVPETPAP